MIEEFEGRENNVVEPAEKIDLRKHGLKGFITAHKEIVTIFVDDNPYPVERGERLVDTIMGLPKTDKNREGYILLEAKKEGAPLQVTGEKVDICGCEQFFTQVDKSKSS